MGVLMEYFGNILGTFTIFFSPFSTDLIRFGFALQNYINI